MSSKQGISTLKQMIPQGLAKFYLENIKKVETPYRDYNHKYKCIFIHIPKTAGTSFGRTIFENRDPSVSHTDALYYKVFEPKLFREYFKFTFVRNPWDRVLSNFNYFRRTDKIERVPQLKETKFLTQYNDFESFVMDLCNPKIREHLLSMYHFRKQNEFIYDYKMNLLIDYLGYFETFNDDSDNILLKLNRSELKIPHLNSSKKEKDYKDVYTDKTRDIVSKLYPEDIELFGYNFDGISKRLICG